MLTLLILAACDPRATLPPVERGTLAVCLDGVGSAGNPPATLDFAGTLTAAAAGDCGYTLTVDDGAGTTHTVGLDAADPEGAAVAPDLADLVGSAVSFTFRFAQPWGAVSGVVVTADDGLVLAAEEGTWGGALGDAQPAGLTVAAGADTVAFDDGECGNRVGRSLVFTGDDAVELTPFAQGDVTVAGVPLTATAFVSDEYDADQGCEMSDTTDARTWAVWR